MDEIIKIQKSFKILTDLKFAILILGLLALGSSLGSFIEQEESIQFYEENYANKIYGIIDSKLILTFGLDHVYTTWWFLSLLILLATSLISCFTRQFPLLENSRNISLRGTSFLILPFSVKLKNLYYLPELLLLKFKS
jgi:cytochrome c biogenesis protein